MAEVEFDDSEVAVLIWIEWIHENSEEEEEILVFSKVPLPDRLTDP